MRPSSSSSSSAAAHGSKSNSNCSCNCSCKAAISPLTLKSSVLSSTSSSASDFSLSDSPIQTTTPVSVSTEEVWRGIGTLATSHHRPIAATGHGPNLRDFLARSISGDDPFFPRDDERGRESIVIGRGWTPPPTTVLSLSSSGSDQFDHLQTSHRTRSGPKLAAVASTPKKRASENEGNSSTCTDWRYNRVMKNRESAARSRARKQAYTNGLENHLARLLEENAKLRKELEQFCSAAPTDPLPKKPRLHRTLTAPF